MSKRLDEIVSAVVAEMELPAGSFTDLPPHSKTFYRKVTKLVLKHSGTTDTPADIRKLIQSHRKIEKENEELRKREATQLRIVEALKWRLTAIREMTGRPLKLKK